MNDVLRTLKEVKGKTEKIRKIMETEKIEKLIKIKFKIEIKTQIMTIDTRTKTNVITTLLTRIEMIDFFNVSKV